MNGIVQVAITIFRFRISAGDRLNIPREREFGFANERCRRLSVAPHQVSNDLHLIYEAMRNPLFKREGGCQTTGGMLA